MAPGKALQLMITRDDARPDTKVPTIVGAARASNPLAPVQTRVSWR